MKLIANNIHKKIKGKTILNDISLEMETGNIYGFWGRNGSGKTMLFRALSGLMKIDSGNIYWNDKELHKDFAVLPSQTSVYKGYKQDKIEMRGDRAEMSDFPLYLNTVAGGLDRRDQTIGGFSFVVKIYAVPVVEIIG